MIKNKFTTALIVGFLAINFIACKHKPKEGPPYIIELEEQVNDKLPQLHSHTYAVYRDKIIMIGGRTNGLHDGNYQMRILHTNQLIYVIDTKNWDENVTNWTVDSAGDKLVTGKYYEAFRTNNTEFFQKNNVLYMVGGIRGSIINGNDTNFVKTMPYITAINLKELTDAVQYRKEMPEGSIRQATDPGLAITGGELELIGDEVKLVFGWNFSLNGGDQYSHQVRSFKVTDIDTTLSISKIEFCSTCWDFVGPNGSNSDSGYFRRRDGSMSAAIDPVDGSNILIYYGGVFKGGYTNFDDVVWIGKNSAQVIGSETFKMRSNVYTCKVIPVYSNQYKEFYATFLGGMRNGQFNGSITGNFVELTNNNTRLYNPQPGGMPNNADSVPYTNQITTLVVNTNWQLKQYLQKDSFPILKHKLNYNGPHSNVGLIQPNTPTFNGSESIFVSTLKDSFLFSNGVIDFDAYLKANPAGGNIGYLHGGILSTTDNSFSLNKQSQVTFASNRIFKVKLVPVN